MSAKKVTVRQLITMLQKFPDDMLVVAHGTGEDLWKVEARPCTTEATNRASSIPRSPPPRRHASRPSLLRAHGAQSRTAPHSLDGRREDADHPASRRAQEA